MWRVFLYALLLTFSGAMGPRAETDSGSEFDPHHLKDSIIVTANRFGSSVGKTIWPVAALSEQSLDQETSISGSLDGIGGVDVREFAGTGSLATLSSWGVFNRQMLLLYNGRVVKDYSLGGFNLSDYSLDELGRIEVVKGPQSAFYGADAVGGVVNLIPRSALANRLELSSRYGTHNLREIRLDFARVIRKVGVGGFGEITSADNARGNSGTRRRMFGLRSEYVSADSRHYLSFSGRYFRDSLGTPGPVPSQGSVPVYGSAESTSLYDHQEDENYSLDARYRFFGEAFGEVQVDLFWEKKNLDYHGLYNYSFSYYTVDSSGPGIDTVEYVDSVDVRYRGVYDKRSSGISARYMRELRSTSLSGGIDWLSGSVGTTNDQATIGTNILGPFAPFQYSYESYNFWSDGQDQLDFWAALGTEPVTNIRFDLSGRLQFVKGRRTQPSYNVGAVYSPSGCLSFKFGYGYAFRLPTIADQFADDVYTLGNVDLNPETSRSAVGTIYACLPSGRMTVKLSVFSQRIDSLIQYIYNPATFRSVPRNVDKFKSAGVDLSVTFMHAERVGLTWGTVYQKAEQTKEIGGAFMEANYVPELKWRIDLDARLHRQLTSGISVVYTSQRSLRLWDDSIKRIGRVCELNASAVYALNEHVRVVLSGNDLTDQERPDQFGFTSTDGDYPSPGRCFSLRAVVDLM